MKSALKHFEWKVSVIYVFFSFFLYYLYVLFARFVLASQLDSSRGKVLIGSGNSILHKPYPTRPAVRVGLGHFFRCGMGTIRVDIICFTFRSSSIWDLSLERPLRVNPTFPKSLDNEHNTICSFLT